MNMHYEREYEVQRQRRVDKQYEAAKYRDLVRVSDNRNRHSQR
jgi:hypothetical protein